MEILHIGPQYFSISANSTCDIPQEEGEEECGWGVGVQDRDYPDLQEPCGHIQDNKKKRKGLSVEEANSHNLVGEQRLTPMAWGKPCMGSF